MGIHRTLATAAEETPSAVSGTQADNLSDLCPILFVLKTGLPREYLPQELGWGTGMTAWRRLHAWQLQGVRQKIHEALLFRFFHCPPKWEFPKTAFIGSVP